MKEGRKGRREQKREGSRESSGRVKMGITSDGQKGAGSVPVLSTMCVQGAVLSPSTPPHGAKGGHSCYLRT